MATIIKMRAARVSDYDAGGSDMRDIQLVAMDRENQALEPGVVQNANLSATFFEPGGAELVHDQLYDVTITPAAPV